MSGSGWAAVPTALPATTAHGQHAQGQVRTVTLLTGDQVRLYAADGTKASVLPGKGRRAMTFQTYRSDGHLYVIPRDAAALVQSGKVDRRLFDVTALAEAPKRASLPLIVTYAKGENAARALTAASGVKVGVLDTGIDQTHPDLAAQVVAAENFTEEDARDVVGHGTHVASTIAGTAAASEGFYKGVAFDAKLLDAKVCQVDGCYESAIMGGMQWATEQGAWVVNISLGGTDTPEVDPLEEAVDTLTAQTGTLFVISAGNEGPGARSVGSPGSADAALTVGAVDKQDAIADFSSRGPRVGDGAIKPDLTAPGVDIVAARSKDGQIGEPVGDEYVSLSGTSMAAPHVVGAAAILAQQHPDWRAGQLKAALMASAKPDAELTPFDQGAGRVDVAKAITQSVTTEPGSLSFGTQRWPHDDDQPVTKTLTYRNTGTTAVTLALASAFSGPDGEPAPAGALTLSASQVTVPAGGTAEVTVTANTRHAGPDGAYGGSVTATAGATSVTTPLAVDKEVESYDLTIDNLDRDGKPAADFTNMLWGWDLDVWEHLSGPNGTAKIRLPKSRYLVQSTVFGGTQEKPTLSQLVQPRITLDRDTTLTYDARDTKPFSVTLDKASARPALVDIGYTVSTANSSLGSSIWAWSFDEAFTAHVGESLPAEEMFGSFAAQLGEPGMDGSFVNTPYRYYLAWFQDGRAYTGFDKTVHDRQLAKVTSSTSRTLPGRQAYKVNFGLRAHGENGWVSASAFTFDLPSKVAEYYQPDGVKWDTQLSEFVLDEEGWPYELTSLESDGRTFRAGKRTTDRWNAAVFGPAFPASEYASAVRSGDDIFASLPLFTDADGHGGGSRADSATTKLFRDGELVASSEEPGYVEAPGVDPDEAGLRLETRVDRSKVSNFSTKVDAAWEFRSGHVDGEEGTPLPLWSVRFAPEVDAHNYAKRKPLTLVPVTAQAQVDAAVGKVGKLAVEVSYDDGDTWHRAPLLPRGMNSWVAVVKPKTAEFVSFRATAEDSSGNELEQTIVRAFGIR